MKDVPGPTIRRLILYYRYLEELAKKDPDRKISSVALGKGVGVTATQVRKDLSYFGPLGLKGVGYEVGSLKNRLEKIIGFNRNWEVVLVGAGNLGRALVYYQKFKDLGLNIVEVFDCDLNKIGNMINGITVKSTKEMQRIIFKRGIKIAVIAVPAEEAQQVAEELVKAGVRAIWNFAPVPLDLDREIIVISEDLSSGIGSLIYRLKKQVN